VNKAEKTVYLLQITDQTPEQHAINIENYRAYVDALGMAKGGPCADFNICYIIVLPNSLDITTNTARVRFFEIIEDDEGKGPPKKVLVEAPPGVTLYIAKVKVDDDDSDD
jgi:hypothetical protein